MRRTKDLFARFGTIVRSAAGGGERSGPTGGILPPLRDDHLFNLLVPYGVFGSEFASGRTRSLEESD